MPGYGALPRPTPDPALPDDAYRALASVQGRLALLRGPAALAWPAGTLPSQVPGRNAAIRAARRYRGHYVTAAGLAPDRRALLARAQEASDALREVKGYRAGFESPARDRLEALARHAEWNAASRLNGPAEDVPAAERVISVMEELARLAGQTDSLMTTTERHDALSRLCGEYEPRLGTPPRGGISRPGPDGAARSPVSRSGSRNPGRPFRVRGPGAGRAGRSPSAR